ncbi:MAG: prefoldin subunit alpha [Candidatus Korarchaeota archaeon]
MVQEIEKEKERIIQAIYSGRSIQNALIEEYSAVDNEIFQIEQALQTIDYFEKSSEEIEAFLPIANHAFIPATVKNPDKVTVAVSKDVLVETSPNEAKRILAKRKERLEKTAQEIEKSLKDLNAQIESLVERYKLLENKDNIRRSPKPT